MTDGLRIDVKGEQMLAATCAAAGRDLETMHEAASQAGQHIAQVAKGKAPRLTGALASSISTGVEGEGAEVGSGLVYAGRTHYGWPAVHQAAQPFLTDALAETQAETLRYYQREVDRALAQVKGA